jgi:hypothetical protein
VNGGLVRETRRFAQECYCVDILVLLGLESGDWLVLVIIALFLLFLLYEEAVGDATDQEPGDLIKSTILALLIFIAPNTGAWAVGAAVALLSTFLLYEYQLNRYLKSRHQSELKMANDDLKSRHQSELKMANDDLKSRHQSELKIFQEVELVHLEETLDKLHSRYNKVIDTYKQVIDELKSQHKYETDELKDAHQLDMIDLMKANIDLMEAIDELKLEHEA